MKRPAGIHELMLKRATALASQDGSWVPPEARPASTVVLLTDSPGGLSSYLMRRVPSMAFAAGMHVFPGGRVDDVDVAAQVEFTASPIDGHRMSAPSDLARGIVVGAVREVFEETGVLLAVDEAGRTPVVDDAWDVDRDAVNSSSAEFPKVLARRGLAIDPDMLPLWSHWITPEVEERRYDVRFFVAAVPQGQPVRDVSGEADRVLWVSPTDALRGYETNEIPMLPPTVATLRELEDYRTVDDVLAAAAARSIAPFLPRARFAEGELVWEVVDARTGEVMWSMDGPPPDSEVRGTR